MGLIKKHVEWFVAVAIVMITTIGFFRSLMGTLDLRIINGCLKYLSFFLIFGLFLYQRHTYGIRIFDKFFFSFYIVYCIYILVDITIFRLYPLERMLAVPQSLYDFLFKFILSILYLLCAKTIVSHFCVKKYLLLSLIVCTIPSIMFIHIVGIEIIQAGISKEDDEYISTLSVTYSNMPVLVLAVMNYTKLFSKKIVSMIVCSFIIAAVVYILSAYGKRGPILWSFISIVSCFFIKSTSIKKLVLFWGIIIAAFFIFMDPILDIVKEELPKTGRKLELSLKEGNTSGRFDTDDPKHSTYLIGLENFSRSPIWGYYFRLVTDYKHYQGVYAHNVFIEILMTMGLLGFVPFMLLLLKVYFKSRKYFSHSYLPNQLAFFALFVCAFLQLQTTGSCVFSNDFWLFLYILCCMDAICAYSSVIRPTSSDIEESIENRRNICF